MRHKLIWPALVAILSAPILLAALSPLLQWRSGIYIAAGFAGIGALVLLALQPLLPLRVLPGASRHLRALHRLLGALIAIAVILHVLLLWITSPPDVVDALLLRSPTPFSLWGVIAMWAVCATALLAVFRRRLRPYRWRIAHKTLAVIIVAGTAAHALLIDGTMETVSKWALCLTVCATTLFALRR